MMFYGGDRPMTELRPLLPSVQTVSLKALKACLIRYALTGWSGLVPAACERQLVLLPIDVAPWLWGWPHRFVQRMESAGSSVFLRGDYQGAQATGAIDTPQDLARVPAGYAGGIWTDEIATIGRMLGRSH